MKFYIISALIAVILVSVPAFSQTAAEIARCKAELGGISGGMSSGKAVDQDKLCLCMLKNSPTSVSETDINNMLNQMTRCLQSVPPVAGGSGPVKQQAKTNSDTASGTSSGAAKTTASSPGTAATTTPNPSAGRSLKYDPKTKTWSNKP